MPFDQFTIEQIAGDLLDAPTRDQRIATGFHRGTPVNQEAGADPEENRVAQVVDRTNVTATVWLGTTLECAQCHDHKHGPFSQREYYQLFSYFNNTPIETRFKKNGVNVKFIGPWLLMQDEDIDANRTLVMVEMDEPRPTHVLKAGSFLDPGERVTPATPKALHPLPKDASANRLGLARWLVSSENPLTARVIVNRAWAEIFGRGLVETVEDFGTSGDPPSHEGLLDWLAIEFRDGGWSMKGIHRLLVTSATYRQASDLNPKRLARDPRNRFYARGPRLRLPAEMIRDNALAISGVLNRELLGRPAYPEQPADLWKGIGGPFAKRTVYATSDAPERYRRGVYTVWRRTAPYPSFANFDAPSRSATCVKRWRSNTPLQALTLMNDPVFVDLAALFAVRIMRAQHLDTVRDRLVYGFRLAVARHPSARETELLDALYRDELERNERDPSAARRLAHSLGPPDGIDVPQWAAWFYVATTLLNLDETITKG
jgi:hypothetical protein